MPKLTGRVTIGGSAATTAVVELHNSQGDVVDQVQVDTGGRYTYHLTPGMWSLNVWDAHGHRARREVALAEDDTSLDVDLDERAQP